MSTITGGIAGQEQDIKKKIRKKISVGAIDFFKTDDGGLELAAPILKKEKEVSKRRANAISGGVTSSQNSKVNNRVNKNMSGSISGSIQNRLRNRR